MGATVDGLGATVPGETVPGETVAAVRSLPDVSKTLFPSNCLIDHTLRGQVFQFHFWPGATGETGTDSDNRQRSSDVFLRLSPDRE